MTKKKRIPLLGKLFIIGIAATIAYNLWARWGLDEVDDQKLLLYEMYPLSWVDQGGFRGMTAQLDHIQDLGIDYIWLAPFYPSGGVDGGYDITDYTDVDPNLGTVEDFDHFVEEANKLNIRVITDLVLNHTSDQHPWFQLSASGDPKYADYYHWSDEDLGWGTMFDGSSAFTWHAKRQQFYSHIYNTSQPDLNWDNPDVRAEFQDIIDFWTLEHGVAGFRIDSVQLIGKNFTKTILPREQLGTTAGLFKYYMHPQTFEILHELLDDRDLFTMGEIGVPIYPMFNSLVAPHGPLTAGINVMAANSIDKSLGFIDTKTSLARAERSLKHWGEHPSYIATLESHDGPRFTSRANIDGKAALDLLFGSDARIICLYQGEELGLTNPELSDNIADYDDVQTIMRHETAIAAGADPAETMTRLKAESRDNARQPLPLEECDVQRTDPNSCFNYTRILIQNWKSN